LSIEWQRAQYVRAMLSPRCALGDAANAPAQPRIRIAPATVILTIARFHFPN
jgi:hypothetical protein